MNRFTSIAAAGLIGLGFVSPASAAATYKFLPNKSTFTVTGTLTVTAAAVSLPCAASMTGTTNGATASITQVTFSGLTCDALTAGNLPWTMSINNAHNLQLHGIEVSAVVLGLCGPGNVPVHIADSNGRLTITGAGLPGLVNCSVTANLTTKPHLSIERMRK